MGSTRSKHNKIRPLCHHSLEVVYVLQGSDKFLSPLVVRGKIEVTIQKKTIFSRESDQEEEINEDNKWAKTYENVYFLYIYIVHRMYHNTS